MAVDQARHHGSSTKIEAQRVRWCIPGRATGNHGLDPIPDDQDITGEQWPPAAVEDHPSRQQNGSLVVVRHAGKLNDVTQSGWMRMISGETVANRPSF